MTNKQIDAEYRRSNHKSWKATARHWVARVGDEYLRGSDGRLRRFGSEQAALSAARLALTVRAIISKARKETNNDTA